MLRVLTWHVHGNYLWYLSHVPVEWVLPVRPGRPEGYGGRGQAFPWPDNVVEVPAEEVPALHLDVVLHQSHRNWLVDRHELLSEAQRELPAIVLEHDPPRASPTDTPHPVDDPDALLVHVTHFNALMWDAGRTPTRVIPHGVVVPPSARHVADLPRGIVAINDLDRRGRRLGADVFARVRTRVPLDLVGMGSERLGGLGEVHPPELPGVLGRYRFFFNPIRYTSLPLALCEAMMVGVPVVALATTEVVTAVEHGVSGFLATDEGELVTAMRHLLADADLAREMGAAAKRRAEKRFGIDRFVRDWSTTLAQVARHAPPGAVLTDR
jgi:hypothetical protein